MTDPVSGVMVGQLNLHQTTGGVVAGDAYDAAGDTADAAAGVCGWSQYQVDAVFYALVADLAGAPQELIDPDDGSVAGWVTQSLYGRRCWRGVDSPLLFIGQYEDQESGWVYNRFRFYDPWSGVYGSQDPLGVAPNPATPYGYVGNPVLWVDPDALKACSGVLSDAMLTMMRHVDDIAVNDKTLRNIFNVAGMVDMDGNIYLASGAAHNLNPANYPGLNIVSLGNPAEWKGLAPHERLYLHAEQKLLNYAKANGIDVSAIYTYLDACPNRKWYPGRIEGLVKGMYEGFATCDLSLRNSGLKPVFNTNLYLSEEALELLKGDQGLKAKLLKLINI
ncbi:RHS repeat domain-containing protein [Corynebacterium durum]|uniref:RHS repeat domain-containing protein n=1 Tax=Corynebacterium durum TaxID=61592 RepID=UPI004025F4AA